MDENVNRKTDALKKMPKRNVHLYLIWIQFYSVAILFIVSIWILKLSPNSNSSPQMIEFSITLNLLGLAFCFFSLIFNMLPAAILFYKKEKFEPSVELKFQKMIHMLMILCAIVFLVSTVGVISGLIIYIF